MATAGSDKLTRRGGQRRPPVGEPVDVGAALREAREAMDASLGEIRDRTGVPWQHLEALEAMELARLPDQRSVVTAARRYAEVVGLDASEVCGTALRAWQDEHWSPPAAPAVAAPGQLGGAAPGHVAGRWWRRNGATGATRPTRPPSRPARVADPATQVLPSKAPEARPHLRAFTQTAEVPSLAGQQRPSPFADTGGVPVTPPAKPRAARSPLWLRLTVAAVALLVVIGAAGLVIQHFEPGWLSAAHLTHRSPSQGAQRTPSAPSRSSGANSHRVVDQVQTSATSATATVHARNYQVLVSAQQACWIQATDPSGSSGSVFSGLLQSGDTKTLDPVGGRLSLQLGASQVTVQVQVRGKPVQGWSFTPTNAPFTLEFAPG